MMKLLGAALCLALFFLVGCASPYQRHLMIKHAEAVDFALDAAKENHCVNFERNKAITASADAVAYGEKPSNYAKPKHLSECEYVGKGR